MAARGRPDSVRLVPVALRGCRRWLIGVPAAGLFLGGLAGAGQPCPNCGPLTTTKWEFPFDDGQGHDHDDGDGTVSVLSGKERPGAAAQPRPLDALQQSVVDSLAADQRDTAPQMLDAAIRAADVDADAAALAWFRRMLDAVADAGDGRDELLADLGDSADQAALLRLARHLRPLDADAPNVLDAMRDAARDRRRSPARMKRAAADLASAAPEVRAAAIAELSKAGIDALPALMEVLASPEPGKRVARVLAREIVTDLGPDARQPLLAILGSPDVNRWQGAILALEAAGLDDRADFLLAPALVGGTPPGAQRAALAALQRHAARLAGEPDPTLLQPPRPNTAITLLAQRLDCALTPQGLPQVPPHPAEGPATVRRHRWNVEAGRFDEVELSPRLARSIDAAHLARDLEALDARDPLAVCLVLLTRVESLLLASGPSASALDAIPPERLAAAFTGPDSLDPNVVTEVMEMAIERGMPEAALAAVWQLEAMHTPTERVAAAPLPANARRALVKLVDAPDERLAFAAARALALVGDDAPYRGSSRVVERLLHAATSRGTDHAVVAHPDLAVGNELAAAAAKYGFRTTVVGSGHEALQAAAAEADTTLVLLGARLALPGAFETLQGLRQAGRGDLPPVMIVVDPLDDHGRGRKLTKLVLQARAHGCVAIVDRLPSFFGPLLDAEGNVVAPPRFPEELAMIAGPEQADPAWRQARGAERLERARQALEILAILGRSGHDVSAAEAHARLALTTPALVPAALKLLAVIGRPGAQGSLVRHALAATEGEIRSLALAALGENVTRYGMLLAADDVADLCRSYTRGSDAGPRETARTILALLPKRVRPALLPPVDAASFRPTR